MEDLVTIAVLPNSVIAEIERNRLLSAGIPAVIDTAVKMGSMYGNFVGGVRVLVRAADVKRAAELLEECDPEDDQDDSAPVDEEPPESVDDPRFKDPGELPDDDSDEQAKNPYRPPEMPSPRRTQDDESDADDDDLEASRLRVQVDRLFRLSVLSWCFPILAPAHLAVVWLAADLKEQRSLMTERDRSRLAWASRLSWIAVLLFVGILILVGLRLDPSRLRP